MTGERDAVAEVLAAPLCKAICDLLGEPRILVSGEVSALLAQSPVADALAGVIAAKQAEALREAGDDQVWWLTEAMDGDFLIVDCGHIGHDGGRVGLSHARPTDLARWVRQGLRDRADRIGADQ